MSNVNKNILHIHFNKQKKHCTLYYVSTTLVIPGLTWDLGVINEELSNAQILK